MKVLIRPPNHQTACKNATGSVLAISCSCFRTMGPCEKNLKALLEAVEDLPPRVRVVIAGAPGRYPFAAQSDRHRS